MSVLQHCSAFKSLPIHEDLDESGSAYNLCSNEDLTAIQKRYHLPPLGAKEERKMTFAKVVAVSQMARAARTWKAGTPKRESAKGKRGSSENKSRHGWRRISNRRPSIFLLQKESKNAKSPDDKGRGPSNKPDKRSMHPIQEKM